MYRTQDHVVFGRNDGAQSGAVDRAWRGNRGMPHDSRSLDDVFQRFAAVPSVAAIAVVGSTAAGRASADADIDVFIYADGDFGDVRAAIAAEFADREVWHSVGERAFGDGDVWRLGPGGPWLDLMYWRPAWAEQQLYRVLVAHRASLGYSTAFWRSIRDAQPVYERDAWHPRLRRWAHSPYPVELRTNIIATNYPYLRDHIFSFRNQVATALHRRDEVSVNHRLAAWLASYIDIILAANGVLHPGEKRLLEIVPRECPHVPDHFSEAIERVLAVAHESPVHLVPIMDQLATELHGWLVRLQLMDSA